MYINVKEWWHVLNKSAGKPSGPRNGLKPRWDRPSNTSDTEKLHWNKWIEFGVNEDETIVDVVEGKKNLRKISRKKKIRNI